MLDSICKVVEGTELAQVVFSSEEFLAQFQGEKQTLMEYAVRYAACRKTPLGGFFETPQGIYVVGWNGPSHYYPHELECRRPADAPSGTLFERCTTEHVEERAVGAAARHGITTDGSTFYLSRWMPCFGCAQKLAASGIVKFVSSDISYQKNSPYRFEDALLLFGALKIEIVEDPSIAPRLAK